ncbi:MAG: SagB family peptide dehydrogenase [Pseudomonadota bacterium]
MTGSGDTGSGDTGGASGVVTRLPTAAGQAEASLCLALDDDVLSVEIAEGRASFHLPAERSCAVAVSSAAAQDWLQRMQAGGTRFAEWSALTGTDPMGATRLLGDLTMRRLLVWWWGTPTRRLIEILPLSGRYMPVRAPADAMAILQSSVPLALSPRIVMQRRRASVALADPVLEAELVINPEGLDLLPALLEEGGEAAGRLPTGLRDVLAVAGFLRPLDAEGPDGAAWNPLALAFHRETRMPLLLNRAGEAMVERPKAPPLARRADEAGIGAVALPDGPQDRRSAPLDEIIARRVSRRRPGPRALTLTELGGLLGGVARYRHDRAEIFPKGTMARNIPGGGGLCETDFNVAAWRVDGLARGLWRYDGAAHRLLPLSDGAAIEGIMEDAAMRLYIDEERPDAVIVVSLRISRLAHKYGAMSYRLAMLHAGVAVEALYLVATDLDLACCAIGNGNGADFERASGHHPLRETALAEFAVSGSSAEP